MGWFSPFDRQSATSSLQPPVELASRQASCRGGVAPCLKLQPEVLDGNAANNKGFRKSSDGAASAQSVYAIPLFKEGNAVRYAFIPVSHNISGAHESHAPAQSPMSSRDGSFSEAPSTSAMAAQIQGLTRHPLPPKPPTVLGSVQR